MGQHLKTYLLVTEKPWHDELFSRLSQTAEANWVRISSKEELTENRIVALAPEKIFFPHWSYIIPEPVHKHFECIVFHMTDLPFGRGGSPLQNLIVRGHKTTVVCAVRVVRELDAGDVYLKRPLSLEGTATDIFNRCSLIIEEMIKEIISSNLTPVPQKGNVVKFKRRMPDDSNIALLEDIEQLYDYIRMLDCDGYPHAFIETEHFRLEFRNAILNSDNTLSANVRISKK